MKDAEYLREIVFKIIGKTLNNKNIILGLPPINLFNS